MIALLGNLDYVLVYIDDILLLQSHDETEYDHLRKMEEVLGKNNTSNTDNNSQQGRWRRDTAWGHYVEHWEYLFDFFNVIIINNLTRSLY